MPISEYVLQYLYYITIFSNIWKSHKISQYISSYVKISNNYTGVTKNTFKQRYYGHSSSFRNREHEFSTTLSSYIWKLKDDQQDYDIRWQVIDRGREFNPTTRKCLLCMKEKYHIIHNSDGSSLNARSELFSTCRHRTRNLLSNLQWKSISNLKWNFVLV